MKKIKKHHFAHTDPEVTPKRNGNVETKTAPSNKYSEPDSYALIKKDLRKTIIVIIFFLCMLVAVYFVQQKTNLLQPILSRFGL